MQILYITVSISLFCFFFHLLPNQWKDYLLLITGLSVSFLFSVKFFPLFITFSLIVFYTSRKLNTKKTRSTFIGSLIFLIGSLIFLKSLEAMNLDFMNIVFKTPEMFSINAQSLYLPVGLSYFIFRLIHYLIESYRGTIQNKSLLIFFNYLFFFPTLIAGPIERFQNFSVQALNKSKINLDAINYGLYRILLGIIKKFIFADSLIRYIIPIFNNPQEQHKLLLLIYIPLLTLHLYLDFSGYTDLAIGISKLLGYRIVENFNKPFLQTNIALFWRNWHISTYTFIRDYFFLPIFGPRTSTLKIYLGLFSSMLLFNLWHRFDISFLILGLYYSFGIVFWRFFQNIRTKAPCVNMFFSCKALIPIFILVNYIYVSFGFLFFYFDFNFVFKLMKYIFV